jgi:hypothetical protein
LTTKSFPSRARSAAPEMRAITFTTGPPPSRDILFRVDEQTARGR